MKEAAISMAVVLPEHRQEDAKAATLVFTTQQEKDHEQNKGFAETGFQSIGGYR